MANVPVDLDQARHLMIVQQIRPWNVFDDSVIDVLETTHRHEFIPADLKNLAYTDECLPIGEGEFMLLPSVEGRLLIAADIVSTDTILEIGTGSAYLTACLAKLGAEVTSIDIHQSFYKAADKKLKKAGINNFKLFTGDASQGWNDGNKYDVIMVTGSTPSAHAGFHESLAVGGRLIRIVGNYPAMEVQRVTRVSENEWEEESLFETLAAPLVNAVAEKKFAI